MYDIISRAEEMHDMRAYAHPILMPPDRASSANVLSSGGIIVYIIGWCDMLRGVYKSTQHIDTDLVVKMYEEGKSCAKIAKELGTSSETIRRRIIKTGGSCRSLTATWETREPNTRESNHRWKGGRCINGRGYIIIHSIGHPRVDGHNYVHEHRLVVEDHIGRYLEPQEVIHHINFEILNNNINNLFLFPNKSTHTSYHHAIARLARQNNITKQEAVLLLTPSDFMASLDAVANDDTPS